MSTLVVGISGKKRSGKDTLCSSLVSVLEGVQCHSRRRALADALKEEAASSLAPQFAAAGISEKQLLAMLYSDEQKEQFRLYLQWHGTEFRRAFFGDDYLTRQMDEYIAAWEFAADIPRKVLFVPDVRFPNEVEWVHSHNGLLIHVERPGLPSDTHSSETALDGFSGYNYRVVNDGDINSLAVQAQNIGLALAARL